MNFRRAFEPVASAQHRIDDIDLNEGIAPQILDSAWRFDVGKAQAPVIQGSYRTLGRKVRFSVARHGCNIGEPRPANQALHVLCQNHVGALEILGQLRDDFTIRTFSRNFVSDKSKDIAGLIVQPLWLAPQGCEPTVNSHTASSVKNFSAALTS